MSIKSVLAVSSTTLLLLLRWAETVSLWKWTANGPFQFTITGKTDICGKHFIADRYLRLYNPRKAIEVDLTTEMNNIGMNWIINVQETDRKEVHFIVQL
jgi:hypothetical protein